MSAQRFGHAPLAHSSEPSQHASSQIPSLTREARMRAGMCPSFRQ
jgi:hypothetical protein